MKCFLISFLAPSSSLFWIFSRTLKYNSIASPLLCPWVSCRVFLWETSGGMRLEMWCLGEKVVLVFYPFPHFCFFLCFIITLLPLFSQTPCPYLCQAISSCRSAIILVVFEDKPIKIQGKLLRGLFLYSHNWESPVLHPLMNHCHHSAGFGYDLFIWVLVCLFSYSQWDWVTFLTSQYYLGALKVEWLQRLYENWFIIYVCWLTRFNASEISHFNCIPDFFLWLWRN